VRKKEVGTANTGWQSIGNPSRIVCTATESVDILYRLGLGDRTIGVWDFTTEPPETRSQPKVGSYTSVNLEAILALEKI
jgi:ABC-type hemin transport system substrate-binding protein